MAQAKSLRGYLDRPEDEGELFRVNQPINKNTETHPLCRLRSVFSGLRHAHLNTL